jgi:dTDP-4-dehydrorhamnose reductase
MRIVKKEWGEEHWIVNREYAGKKMVLYKNHRCSLHYHKIKDETFYVIKGCVLLELNDKIKILKLGDSILIKPNDKHRFTGLEESEIIEFSTHHYDEDDRDNYRLEFSGKVTANELLKIIPLKKIYITGSKGYLGEKLMEVLQSEYIVKGSDKEIDITSDNIKREIETFSPDILINAAAYADYKECEKNPALAEKINIRGVENLAEICLNNTIKFVQISTDFVFDGKKGYYKEEDGPNPINVYGRTKAEAEKKLLSNIKDLLIIRTSTFYGFNINNKRPVFVNKVIDQLSNEKKYPVAADEISTPTLIDDLAEAIASLIKKEKNGVWNIAGKETVCRYNLALKVAHVFNLNKDLIIPSTVKELGLENVRPKNCSLDTTKLSQEGIMMHSIIEGLKIMKEQIKNFRIKRNISSGVVLINNQSNKPEILLIKNKKSGMWGFPKGHVEDKETLIETAIREVKEEIGLEINSLKMKPSFESNYIDDNGNNKKVIYFIRKIKKTVPKLNDEIDAYMWADLEKSYEILKFPELKEIVKKIKPLLKQNE